MISKSKTNFQIALSLFLFVFLLFISIQYLILSQQNRAKKLDLSQINHVRYGLLNIDEWEDKVAIIIAHKVNDFELMPENRDKLKASLEKILYQLVDDFEAIFNTRTSGSFSGVKKWLASFALDIEEIRESVPQFAESILEELNKPETKAELKALMLIKLEEFVETTFNKDSLLELQALMAKYGYEDKQTCHEELSELIRTEEGRLNLYTFLILTAIIVLFLVNLIPKGNFHTLQVLFLVLSSLSLLLVGVATPMIELEARIDLLLFQLLGEEIAFKEQIFFFQSKSILNVVQILMSDGSVQMIFVGLLIFTFSVLFPLCKLLSSYLYFTSEKLRENKLIKFFVLKSGKWSMADVMVVALFMAYIGFNGVVSSQLNNLSDNAKPIEILSTNGTQLVGGFYLFLAFCLSSLVLSGALTRRTL